MPAIVEQDPDDRLIHTWDWSDLFGATTVTGATVATTGTVAVSAPTIATPLVSVYVSGLAAAGTATVTCHATTADAQQADWTVTFMGRQR